MTKEELLRQLYDETLVGNGPAVLELTNTGLATGLGPETLLERRATVIADLEETDGAVTLVFEGKEIGFPAHAEPELRACFEAEDPFCASGLPGELDADGRLVLARRLVREGFLRVVAV